MTFKDRLSVLGFPTYEAYLASEHWQAFKKEYQRRRKSIRCRICGLEPAELHHHTYERLGRELLDDVDPLCRVHHEQVHRILDEKNWSVDRTAAAIRFLLPPEQDHVCGKAGRRRRRQKQYAWKKSRRHSPHITHNLSDPLVALRAIAAGVRLRVRKDR